MTSELAPERIGLALTPDDVRQIAKSGRKVALIGVENAYPVGLDIENIARFADRGARYMSSSISYTTATVSFPIPIQVRFVRVVCVMAACPILGRQAVAEMNRQLGLVD